MPAKELQTLVSDLAGLINVGFKVVKGDFLSLLGLLGTVKDLQSVDFNQVKADLLTLSDADRATLESQFDSALSLSDSVIQQKIVDSADALNQAITVGEEAVKVYEDVLSVVNRFKSILGV